MANVKIGSAVAALVVMAGCASSEHPAGGDAALCVSCGPTEDGGPVPPREAGKDSRGAEASPAAGDACSGSALADIVTPKGVSWIVVRLGYRDRAVLGWQYGGSDGATASSRTSETQARATALHDTGHGDGGSVLSADSPDEWVFYESRGDLSYVELVSARSGQTVFGGSIIYAGTGSITYPESWRAPELLGRGCSSRSAPPRARGFDLTFASDAGTSLSESAVSAAVDAVWDTALPEAVSRATQHPLDAVVVLYPKTAGPGADLASTAEWLVVVNTAT